MFLECGGRMLLVSKGSLAAPPSSIHRHHRRHRRRHHRRCASRPSSLVSTGTSVERRELQPLTFGFMGVVRLSDVGRNNS